MSSSKQQAETPEPWAPEGAAKVGLGPRADREGERGSSAYSGDGATDERGPASGVDYFPDGVPVNTGISEHSRESATR